MPFSSIIGHERVIESLKGAILNRRIGQAYLFSGPERVGKKLVALSFAKALNCEGQDGDFCNTCRDCRKIEDGNHPDVMVLEPQGRQIRIEQIRSIQDFFRFGPLEGRWKICIIDGAERMNLHAANSLLKTLEEPLSRRIVILVAGRGGFIPPTILSRCQRINFGPIKEEKLAMWLERHLKIDREEARLRARFGEGSLSRALEVEGNYMNRQRDKILNRLKRFLRGERAVAFEWAEEFSKMEMEDIDRYMGLMKLILRDLMLYRIIGKEGLVLSGDLLEKLKDLIVGSSPEYLIELWERVETCHRALYENMNRQLAFEWMLLGGSNQGWRNQ